MGRYEDLGIRRVVNAAATLTRLGGSLSPEPVLAAMAEGARWYVDMEALERAVSARIAALTHNEACTVTGGAAAGLVVSAAGCMTRGSLGAAQRLPDAAGLPNRIVLFRNQRTRYDQALRLAGAQLIEIGYAVGGTYPAELEDALTDQTAAVVYVAGSHLSTGPLPLAQVIAIAGGRGVPVIVDAAAQLPPVENLWRFAEMGAALVLFSGGKGLCGPQATGLVLGRAKWVEYARLCNSPRYAPGRPMKVSKEELLGILAAVEWYLAQDHPAMLARWEEQVAYMVQALDGVSGLSARRDFPSEAGQPVARARVEFGPDAPVRRDQAVLRLRAGDPAVEVLTAEDDVMFLNPVCLEPGEERLVAARVLAVLHGD